MQPEQLIPMLREAEVEIGQGRSVREACRKLGIHEHTLCHWRREHGGLKLDQVKRMKELELENCRLKQVVALAYENGGDGNRIITALIRRRMSWRDWKSCSCSGDTRLLPQWQRAGVHDRDGAGLAVKAGHGHPVHYVGRPWENG